MASAPPQDSFHWAPWALFMFTSPSAFPPSAVKGLPPRKSWQNLGDLTPWGPPPGGYQHRKVSSECANHDCDGHEESHREDGLVGVEIGWRD